MPLTTVDQGLLSTNAQYTGFKNRIINGGMVIDQRNNGASVALTGGVTQYTLDRWNAIRVNSGGAVSVQRSTNAPAGFVNSLQVTVGTSVATASTDYTNIGQRVEGFNVSDFGWGTSSAVPAVISFWVRSSQTGNFGLSIQNISSYSFVGSYTINSANTWEYKTVSIPAPTTSTFPTDNSASLYINWDLGVGSAFSGAAGSWTASNIFGLTGGVKLSATTGATWNITGVQLEKGSTATSFDYRPYGTELALCQRYCVKMGGNGGSAMVVGYGVAANSTVALIFYYPLVNFRSSPTLESFSSLSVDDTNGGSSVSNLVIDTPSTGPTFVRFNATSSGLTQFRPYYLRASSSTGNYILSAEL
jgi:hypothetical protein